MKVSIFFTPLNVTPHMITGKPVLVVDVLRATTTVVAAMSRGARAVIPAATADEALRLAQNLERETLLLCGERKLEPIPGFDLGNSPTEMTENMVRDKTLIMATTNGTPAITAAEHGDPVLIGAVTNFSAVVERAREAFEEHGEINILCAGRERMFAIEDAYVAGRFVEALLPDRRRQTASLNDGAIAALELVRRYGDQWNRAITASSAAHELTEAGFRADVTMATEPDVETITPLYADRLITLPTRD